MTKTIRWGILAPGKIAAKFASAFELVPGASLHAVASRDSQRAKAFATQFRIPVICKSYEELASHPEIDAIYIASPHNFHHEQTLLCLHHQHAVLCEKPLTLTLDSAKILAAKARETNTFLMEGMWSRFFPSIVKMMDLIREGAIGTLRYVQADFGFTSSFDPTSRIYNLDLAAGAQLDVGVYPMFLAMLVLGNPEEIQTIAIKASTGADETTSAQFRFSDGSLAHIFSSVTIDTPKQAEIMGSKGSIILHAPWYKSQALTMKLTSGESKQFDFPFEGFGFQFELQHVTECLQKGLKESPLMSLDFSLQMAGVADIILSQSGVVYPHAFS